MRIFSFLEWSESNIRGKVMCNLDYRHCFPNPNINECVECYEDYVNKQIPKYCKGVADG